MQPHNNDAQANENEENTESQVAKFENRRGVADMEEAKCGSSLLMQSSRAGPEPSVHARTVPSFSPLRCPTQDDVGISRVS